MKRVFLDANVLFTAAHNPRGKAALVIETSKAHGRWVVASNHYAVEEARRNLQRKYPGALKRLAELVQIMDLLVSGDGKRCPLPLPAGDRIVFEGATRFRATHFLTGDRKDFGAFMNDPEAGAGIVIQTVAEFLAAITESQ